MIIRFIHVYRYQILSLLFICNLLAFWPGIAMHDSAEQYQQAILGKYTDHHPPLMSFIWHYLNQIHSGYGLMFILQTSLMYSGILILMFISDYIFQHKKCLPSILLLAIPIYPQVLIYDVMILKDVQFAASFLLASSILAYYTILPKKISPIISLTLISILIYGAAIKFQGQYCAIIPSLWMGYVIYKKHKTWKKILSGIAIYAIILLSIFYINKNLVSLENQNHSWQYVKIYDLAAISLQTNEDLIPAFNKTATYSFKELENKFGYPAVDSLVFSKSPILKATKIPNEMQNLYNQWLKTVTEHPGIYLKHRLYNMKYILISRPGYEQEVQDIPFALTNNFHINSLAYKLTENIIGIIFYLFMSHLTTIILGLCYLALGLYYWNKSSSAKALVGFSLTAIIMVILLFFMSMAGTPRYTYISITLIHASHIFAYSCITNTKSSKNSLHHII